MLKILITGCKGYIALHARLCEFDLLKHFRNNIYVITNISGTHVAKPNIISAGFIVCEMNVLRKFMIVAIKN